MLEDTAVFPLQGESRQPWPAWKRVAFRFAFVYWAIYMLPSPGAVSLLDLLPWLGDKVSVVLGWPMHALAPWVGLHVFHLTGEAAAWHPSGSGDTAMHWMMFVINFVVALVGAGVWSAISEVRGRRTEYRTAYAWLRLLLRFMLAITLLEYGFIKIFPLQFGPLGPYGLTESFGDASPMHLLWTFIGQSPGYMMFGGLMEVIPGILLLFRRTSTVGAMGAVAVMMNVAVLNFCYDVPVKLYSVHLLLMALFLLLPDAGPMWRFLIARKEAALTGVWVPRWERKPLRVGAHVLQGLVVVAALYGAGWSSYEETRERESPSPLQGVYAVDAAAGFGADAHWIKAFFDDRKGMHSMGLVGPDNKPTRFAVTYDLKAQTVRTLESNPPASFHWSRDQTGQLVLDGSFKGVPASLHLHKTSPDVFALNARGFHWVTEMPYNR